MNVLISLAVSATIALFCGVLKMKKLVLPVVILGLLAALFCNSMYWNTNESFFKGMMLENNYAVAFSGVIIFLALVLILFYENLSSQYEFHLAEIYAIILYSIAGGVVMLSYSNLLMLFLGVEILSLSFYVLTGIRKRNIASNEAAIKYFLMGSFSTGFMLFGMALIYGASGSFNLNEIAAYVVKTDTAVPAFFFVGILLILVSLMFKSAVAPFHFWTPDVYDGAPTLITALMATVGKIASFGAFFLLFNTCFAPLASKYQFALWATALLSMSIGNIIALTQTSVKRMLAYSSIAHAGYMLLAVVSMNNLSAGSVLFYSVAYGLASMAAFIIVFIVKQQRGTDTFNAFKGLAKDNKALSFVLAVSMLSLAGIPLTAGFFGKFYMFGSAVQSGNFVLVALAIVNSFIGAYYYLKPVIAAYSQPDNNQTITVPVLSNLLLIILTILTLLTGIIPSILTGII